MQNSLINFKIPWQISKFPDKFQSSLTNFKFPDLGKNCFHWPWTMTLVGRWQKSWFSNFHKSTKKSLIFFVKILSFTEIFSKKSCFTDTQQIIKFSDKLQNSRKLPDLENKIKFYWKYTDRGHHIECPGN